MHCAMLCVTSCTLLLLLLLLEHSIMHGARRSGAGETVYDGYMLCCSRGHTSAAVSHPTHTYWLHTYRAGSTTIFLSNSSSFPVSSCC